MFDKQIMRVIYEGFDEMILREGSISKLRSGCQFLDMKLDGNEPSDCF